MAKHLQCTLYNAIFRHLRQVPMIQGAFMWSAVAQGKLTPPWHKANSQQVISWNPFRGEVIIIIIFHTVQDTFSVYCVPGSTPVPQNPMKVMVMVKLILNATSPYPSPLHPRPSPLTPFPHPSYPRPPPSPTPPPPHEPLKRGYGPETPPPPPPLPM